ncbi:protein ABHD18-like [Mya arenaria]|uniref:protein ABHD18-like n=1 Tax=Mya arenaria TaxID=6604 RepID=UPI0022E61B42|nr:protein ABHD18-like [Mya arenaria]
MSKLDWFWRWFIVTKIYTKGWGNPVDMKRIMLLRKRLGNREALSKILPRDYPVYIDKETRSSDFRLLEGHFLSPVNDHCPGIMPKDVEVARFEMVLPNEWKSDLRPMCVHMGGTGDHGFGRRRRMFAKPLLKAHGIASLILENPYYGCRKPKQQLRSSLHHVTDLFVMGAGLIMESNILFNWLDRQGYGPLGATGVSMGGHMASLGACSWHKPISLIPCLAGSTAAGVFTHGVLSTAIPWKILEKQYQDVDLFREEIMGLIESPEPYWNSKVSMYQRGKDFFHKLKDDCLEGAGPNSQENQPDLLVHSAHTHRDIIGADLASDSFYKPSITCDTSHISGQSASEDHVISKPQENGSSQGWVNSIVKSIPRYLNLYKGKNDNSEAMRKQLELDCKHFMKGVMDECTHLDNFSRPLDPELIKIVIAKDDEYIPHSGYMKLEHIWPGSQVRYISGGHIMGYLGNRKIFTEAIAESFEIHSQKYFNKKVRQSSS